MQHMHGNIQACLTIWPIQLFISFTSVQTEEDSETEIHKKARCKNATLGCKLNSQFVQGVLQKHFNQSFTTGADVNFEKPIKMLKTTKLYRNSIFVWLGSGLFHQKQLEGVIELSKKN